MVWIETGDPHPKSVPCDLGDLRCNMTAPDEAKTFFLSDLSTLTDTYRILDSLR